jgi:hypothetical protein
MRRARPRTALCSAISHKLAPASLYGDMSKRASPIMGTTLQPLRLALLATFALGACEHACAQDASRSPPKWPPKDGVYDVPGPGFSAQCGEMNGAFVELAANSIGGDEDTCTISKMIDSAPGTLRLEATCEGVQIEKPSKEVYLLSRLDEGTFLWRQITPGKESNRGTRFSYCPEDIQRLYRENVARYKAEAERRAAEKRSQQKR